MNIINMIKYQTLILAAALLLPCSAAETQTANPAQRTQRSASRAKSTTPQQHLLPCSQKVPLCSACAYNESSATVACTKRANTYAVNTAVTLVSAVVLRFPFCDKCKLNGNNFVCKECMIEAVLKGGKGSCGGLVAGCTTCAGEGEGAVLLHSMIHWVLRQCWRIRLLQMRAVDIRMRGMLILDSFRDGEVRDLRWRIQFKQGLIGLRQIVHHDNYHRGGGSGGAGGWGTYLSWYVVLWIYYRRKRKVNSGPLMVEKSY